MVPLKSDLKLLVTATDILSKQMVCSNSKNNHFISSVALMLNLKFYI